ncbi:hypothetical protein, partial [Enterobacter asburiae]
AEDTTSPVLLTIAEAAPVGVILVAENYTFDIVKLFVAVDVEDSPAACCVPSLFPIAFPVAAALEGPACCA